MNGFKFTFEGGKCIPVVGKPIPGADTLRSDRKTTSHSRNRLPEDTSTSPISLACLLPDVLDNIAMLYHLFTKTWLASMVFFSA